MSGGWTESHSGGDFLTVETCPVSYARVPSSLMRLTRGRLLRLILVFFGSGFCLGLLELFDFCLVFRFGCVFGLFFVIGFWHFILIK